jgi:hypothetical protein
MFKTNSMKRPGGTHGLGHSDRIGDRKRFYPTDKGSKRSGGTIAKDFDPGI